MKHKKGDRVRHAERPEWGIGEVTKVEILTRDGKADRRVWIRFPSVGTKTLLASMASLEGIDEAEDAIAQDDNETFIDREATHDTGWLGDIAKNKPEDAMIAIPQRATDPFSPIRARVQFIVTLYRFESTGGKLVDWAVAQTGMDDPLTHFNRHELEQFFERWMWERDRVLAKTIEEARRNNEQIEDLLANAPASVKRGIKRGTASR